MTRSALSARLAATAALALVLAACDDRGGARVDAPEPAPLAVLDAAATLPYAGPASVGRYAPDRGYRWAERAYGEQRIFYDTPPDYGFDYGDAEWMVWETADDWAMYAEPWDDGYRYYYFEPGAYYPYFVRDRYYGYGFDSLGVLVVVVDAGGRYLPAEQFRTVAPLAGRYFAQGRELRGASSQARRIAVDERTWATRAPLVTRTSEPWLKAAREDRGWRKWREADRGRELQRFATEERRRADIQRTRTVQDVRQADRNRDAELRSAERGPDRRGGALPAEPRRELGGPRAHQGVAWEARAREQQAREQAQAERRGYAQRQAQAEAQQDRRAQQQAQVQERHSQQVQVEHQQQAERVQRAQAERQQHEAARVQQGQAERAQQAQARAAEQQEMRAARQAEARAGPPPARAAEQQARAAVAHERAARPAKAAAPGDDERQPHAKDHGRKD